MSLSLARANPGPDEQRAAGRDERAEGERSPMLLVGDELLEAAEVSDRALVEGPDTDAAALVAAGYVPADERGRITTLWMSPEAQDRSRQRPCARAAPWRTWAGEILTRALR